MSLLLGVLVSLLLVVRLLLLRLIRFMSSLSRLFSPPLLWPLLVMASRFMAPPG
ncbi:MAG: hypothetical protein ACLSAF_15655 [Intestinimonas sp.]